MLQFTLDMVGFLAAMVQVVLPLIVALVTRWQTKSSTKAGLLLALTGVTQFVAEWYRVAQQHQVFDWKTTLFNIVLGFALAGAAHVAGWRHTGLQAGLQSVGSSKRYERGTDGVYRPAQ